jgi:hypothetical protein
VIKILVGLVIIASIGGNLYYFGYKKLEAKLLEKGFNLAIGQIINSVEKTGQVKLSDKITLIKK